VNVSHDVGSEAAMCNLNWSSFMKVSGFLLWLSYDIFLALGRTRALFHHFHVMFIIIICTILQTCGTSHF